MSEQEKKISFSISPFPPFVSLNFDVPFEKLIGGLFRSKAKPMLAGELVAWCLQAVLNDQFTDGDVTGAWSIKYPEYIGFLYHKGNIPPEISVRDSITISAWVAIALNKYHLAFPHGDVAKVILPRLDLLKTYLKRRYNSKIKGFGLTTSAKIRGPVGIHVDPRHTAWAILTLWELGFSDIETNKMLTDSGSYLMSELNSLSPNEYAVTYAALHRLLSTQGVSSIITLSDLTRNAIMKRLESYIIEKYDSKYMSWDLEPDNIERTRMDYAFDVLMSMRIASC